MSEAADVKGEAPQAEATEGEKGAAGGAEPKQQLTEKQAKLLLIGLTVYVLVLAVLAVDQIFELGLVRPELDRDLIARIETLNAPPQGVPTGELGSLRGAMSGFLGMKVDPRLVPVALDIHDTAYGFEVGSLPSADELQSLAKKVGQLRKLRPPIRNAQAVDGLAKALASLQGLVAKVPTAQAKALSERHDQIEYVVNYHEFSIDYLIRALRKADAPGQAAAAYGLHQIAWRFFRHRGSEGANPAKWKEWWQRTEADLERRSRR